MSSLLIQIQYNDIIHKIKLSDVTKEKLGTIFQIQVDFLIDDQNEVHFPNKQGSWTNLHGKTVYKIKSMY